jgi:membrane protein YdbS with pleckstrin-like domain
MTAAMYSITIGTSSHSKLMFGLSIMMCIVYSVAFGLIAGGGATTQAEAGKAATSAYFALPAIVAIAIIHAFERFNRHIIDRAPYWNFSGAAER